MTLAIVLGGASCMRDDLSRLERMYPVEDAVVIAVNDAGWAYPGKIDHWVTLHVEHLGRWVSTRRELRRNMDFETWTRAGPKSKQYQPTDHVLGHWGKGSSGLFAVTVAQVGLRLDKGVLCGVPMSTAGNVSGKSEWPVEEVMLHRGGWVYHLDRIRDTWRSMSGWTKGLLGAPTEEWLR